ncbi:MAG: hypothetical protein NPIRA03_09960 [Nitrospirales bacterium]|nr:MAG: hypothetical protein NPIRA03_09960 [Nitrospirales bacterium]
MKTDKDACEEQNVAGLYQDTQVAESYCQRRFAHSWSSLLHRKQVTEVNRALAQFQPGDTVELAPGPARLTTEIRGVQRGIMVEYSHEMLTVAQKRLSEAGLASRWDLRHGNAFDLQSMDIHCDFLFTFRFIRHFIMSDRIRLYKQIHHCLRPGGYFIMDVVNRIMRERIEAQSSKKSKNELPVYDMAYTPCEFEDEIEEHGFVVRRLIPVIKHFGLQSWVSFTLDHRIASLAYVTVAILERVPSLEPLEWIAVCQKME